VEIKVIGLGPMPKTLLKYLREFRRTRPDVVHCHNPAPTLQAALPARLAGVRAILSTRHSLVDPPYDVTAEKTYNRFARSCDWIVGICEATCVNLRGTPGALRDRIVRVYNGVDPVVPVPAEARPQKRGLTLLFVGRLAAIKNLETLIRATALALPRLPELQLWVVGGGDERSKLEAMAQELGIAESVTFWGERLDVAGFFSSADIFCMSSTSEGLPMSLLQAMSVGVPAIVTDVGGMAEVVRFADAGRTAPVGDFAAMAEAIVQMATDESERLRFAGNARKAYQDHFTLEAMERTYLKLYEGRS
jgi:L-malate glycosyltransferase